MKINQAEFLQSLLEKGSIESRVEPHMNGFMVVIDDILIQEEIFNLIFSRLSESPAEIIQYFKWEDWEFVEVDCDHEAKYTIIK